MYLICNLYGSLTKHWDIYVSNMQPSPSDPSLKMYHDISISFDWCDFIYHSGVQGGTDVFSSVGGNATLHCSNVVYPNCSSTVWDELESREELILHGKMNPDVDTHRAKRLSLLSDCSLHITDVTPEDAGLYLCEQYLRVGEPLHGEIARVYLHVLKGRCYCCCFICCCFQALRCSVTEVKWICWIYLVGVMRYPSVFNWFV